jgi:hypothetical protein
MNERTVATIMSFLFAVATLASFTWRFRHVQSLEKIDGKAVEIMKVTQ